jgi:transcriptional regulator with XRE-family HTH domain
MPSRGENKRRLTSHEIATLHVRRTKLVSALRAYLKTADRPFWWIAAEVGVAKSALRNWKNGKTKPKFEYLDRIEAFLRRQKHAGRNSSEILKAFRRFYCETSLSDCAIARMIGVDPVPIPSWIKGIPRPQLANLRKIDRFIEKYAPEYLSALPGILRIQSVQSLLRPIADTRLFGESCTYAMTECIYPTTKCSRNWRLLR